MALNTPVDREFAVLARGHIRDKVVLANFREGLRALVNPETGNKFTADEIQRATQVGSRWYVGAQAIDDYGQSDQRKALWMADQIRLERASTKWLEGYHARLWGEDKLEATGGSGPVAIPGVPGTIVLGSTTLGDPSAYTARDPAGNVYQVMIGGTIGAEPLELTLKSVGVGSGTNPDAGTLLTWVTRDPNMGPQATVAARFSGGTDRETDGEHASRIGGIIRHKPAAGNDAHVRAWARAASNAIEDGCVYACAFYAGSTLISIIQKRGKNDTRPTARQPSVGTLATAIGYLTPPLSPVVPWGFVVVTGWTAEASDLALRVAVPKGSSSGYLNSRPFPSYHATTPRVTAKVSDTNFTISCPGDATLPGLAPGATGTFQLMLWRPDVMAFAVCAAATVTDLGGSLFSVVLPSPPAGGVTIGQRVSPSMSEARSTIVATTIRDYFDSLGPGELFDTANDSRGGRCVRVPAVTEERPFRAGSLVATRVIEALGGSAADGVLADISQTVPTYPTNLMNGPNMLVCGHVGIYDLT